MNHPHKSQAAAMDTAGELPDGEQLRECINSGQVSAAQVVAHAENGEIMVTPYVSQANFDKAFPVTTGWPAGMLQDDSRQLSKALSRDPNARALARDAVADGILISRLRRSASITDSMVLSDTLEKAADALVAGLAALAAERAEVVRLREALEGAYALAIGHATTYQLNHQLAEVHPTHQAILDKARAALTAPGEKHD